MKFNLNSIIASLALVLSCGCMCACGGGSEEPTPIPPTIGGESGEKTGGYRGRKRFG